MATQATPQQINAVAQATKQVQALAAQVNAKKTTPTPSPVSNVVNPHDLPSYNPATDPTSSAYGRTPTAVAPATPTTPTTQPVTTTTPNPATTTINPPNATATPTGTTQATPEQVAAVATATQQVNDLATQVKTGLANTKAAGTAVSDTAGGAQSVIDKNTQPVTQPVPPNPMTDPLQQSAEYQQQLADHTAFMNSINQRESLTQTYTDLSNQLGIPALNTELMNMKNIIDGTEQDIRDEVTKAGGFATESQVAALSNARDKTIIQNYNNLLETRNNAQTQLTTMIGLTEQDRAAANQAFTEQLNFDQQMVNYRQTAITNGVNKLDAIQKTEGWDGIYQAALASGDPTAVARINATMGQGFNLAVAAQNDFKTKQAQENLARTQAQTAETEARTAELNLKNAQTSGSGYTDTGVKLNNENAKQQVIDQWNKSGILKNGTGTASMDAYNNAKSWWVAEGLKSTDFDVEFAPYKPGWLTRITNTIF